MMSSARTAIKIVKQHRINASAINSSLKLKQIELDYSLLDVEGVNDASEKPLHIIGNINAINSAGFQSFRSKISPYITDSMWQKAMSSLKMKSSEQRLCATRANVTCMSLYLDHIDIGCLPTVWSRHNSNSQAHTVTKLASSMSAGRDEIFVICCNWADAFASGCAVARSFALYSRKSAMPVEAKSTPRRIQIQFAITDRAARLQDGSMTEAVVTDMLTDLGHAADGILLTGAIVDSPCSEMDTLMFVDIARKVAADLGLPEIPFDLKDKGRGRKSGFSVISGSTLKQHGFGGLFSVGHATLETRPPALVVLSHVEPPSSDKGVTVAWVGKGIVYDTGGLSIKGKAAMPGMKRDCGGAAAILSAFSAAVRSGLAPGTALHAVLCLAENGVGPAATRPDDIITLYSGRTIEVNNTDAEGRLVVGDGVAYAEHQIHADVIVDMCTLTGAQGIATGRFHAGHMSNFASWETWASEAGISSADLTFPMVFTPELHMPEYHSAVADMKNSAADRSNALSSCAGLFIFAQLSDAFSGTWLHFDIASPSFSAERGTGYGVALLLTLFGKYFKSQWLRAASPITTKSGARQDSVSPSKRTRS